ncbi:predicted protein [Arabidopsis lyrata subsp. lyrata]|uniref:Predicted protein n=1 Tax=Arabidopsis lyrata subsp. lyrata TaxID=81972 RepID=D7LLW7_ARALL|nr:predicted protein [Arabidopsis lyrata subsp. lyrata]
MSTLHKASFTRWDEDPDLGSVNRQLEAQTKLDDNRLTDTDQHLSIQKTVQIVVEHNRRCKNMQDQINRGKKKKNRRNTVLRENGSLNSMQAAGVALKSIGTFLESEGPPLSFTYESRKSCTVKNNFLISDRFVGSNSV